MLSTAQSLHVAFLDGIKKSYQGTVPPETFVRIWNEWAMPEWLSSNVSINEGIDLTQKQIDDLSVLIHRFVFVAATVNPNIYPIPTGNSVHKILFNGDEVDVKLPKYYRKVNIRFKLNYDSAKEQECSLKGISDWLGASFLNSDQVSAIYKSVYRTPKDSLLYWRRHQAITLADEPTTNPVNKIISTKVDSIEMITDAINGSQSKYMLLEYIAFPKEISFNPAVSSELWEEANREIVMIAVRLYLERVRDPRYQSFLMEQKINNINKF